MIQSIPRHVLLLVIACVLNSGAQDNRRPGIIVEEVAKGSAAEQAGLLPGDILLTWTRGDSRGEVESPFDVTYLEIEQSPRGPVALTGLRSETKKTWTLGPSQWGLETKPPLPDALQSSYRQGQELVRAGMTAEAAQTWIQAGGAAHELQPPWLEIWLLLRAGAVLAKVQQWEEVDRVYQRASAHTAGISPVITTQLFRTWAKTYQQRSDWARAEEHYQRTITEGRRLSAESLLVAKSLNDLGNVSYQRGGLAKAGEYYYQALEVRQTLAPGSLDVAASFVGLGNVAWRQADLTKAEAYFRQALEIQRKLAPRSLDAAGSFNNLGVSLRIGGIWRTRRNTTGKRWRLKKSWRRVAFKLPAPSTISDS